MSIYRIDLFAVTETHINNEDKTKLLFHEMKGDPRKVILNNDYDNTHNGTLLLHKLNKRRNRIFNTNIIHGRLQFTTLVFANRQPLHIIIIYNYTGDQINDEEMSLINEINNILIKFNKEPLILIGDINADTFNPSSLKDKIWLDLLSTHRLYELSSDNPSYIRRSGNKIHRTRSDHMYANRYVRIVREDIMPPVSKNDHLPIRFEIEILNPIRSWKRFIPTSEFEKVTTSLFAAFETKDFNSLENLIKEVSIQRHYVPSLRYKESKNTKDTKDKIAKVLKEMKENDAIDQMTNEIKELNKELEQSSKLDTAQIRKEWIDKINTKNISYLFKFDDKLNSKEINWNSLPHNVTRDSTLKFFKEKFTSQNQNINIRLPKSTVKKGPPEITITNDDVKGAIARIKSHSTGPDFIPNKLLKNMKEDDIKKLTFEFNKMLEEENIPEAMKKGWIKLIPKKDKVESHRDIRPITIMNTLYRLLFNIVAFKLRPWANENLNYRQQAFISNRQVNNHIMVLQGLRQRIKKGFVVTNLDIENAYDSVEHQCLEQALKHCKFPKKLMNFILNAYKGHECTIEWNDSLSEPFVKTRGVPQGCPFAPLAYDCITQIIIDKAIDEWNIPIKPSTISPNAIGLKFFADDLSVVGDVNNKYQERIDDVSKWINELHLKINTKKSLMTVIPHRKHPDFQIKINGENVPRTDNQRTLGNYLTEDSSFKEEIKRRILKIQQLLQLMPIHLIEPRNLNQITMSKTISSFTHIIRGNPVSRTLLQGIDRTIRKQCRKLLQIDMRTSKASLYLPIEKGGLNIPNIELFSKLITIKTIQYQGHSNNCLVKKAVVQSLQNCKKCKTKNLNYWENVWDICNENNLKIIFGRSDHRFKTPKAHKKEREIAIWTDGSRSKDGTGIGILIQSSNATTCHKYKLDPRYTHNMAELSAVVTSLKLIPSSSSVTITTDSEIAQKIFTNNNYRGQFIQLKREYEATIQDKKLKVTIEWVKGHDKCQENNFVDKLAKNASTKGKFLDPKNLFTQEQLLIIKDSLWIPNPCRIIRNNWLSQISENSQVTNLVSDTTFRYIEGKSTPHHKYSIWRNLNFCHVRSFKQHICPECNVPLSHEHLILQCPLLQFQRKWAIDNIKKHTNRDPILVSTESDHLNNYKFYLNYKGILQHNTIMDSISLFHREWFNIQSTLSLLAGHAHTQYWKIVQ